MTLGPAKHEKVARIGRISNVFRIAGAQSAEQSVGIVGTKYILTLTSYFHYKIKLKCFYFTTIFPRMQLKKKIKISKTTIVAPTGVENRMDTTIPRTAPITERTAA